MTRRAGRAVALVAAIILVVGATVRPVWSLEVEPPCGEGFYLEREHCFSLSDVWVTLSPTTPDPEWRVRQLAADVGAEVVGRFERTYRLRLPALEGYVDFVEIKGRLEAAGDVESILSLPRLEL